MGLTLNGVTVEVLIKQGHLEINTASRRSERAERAPRVTLRPQAPRGGRRVPAAQPTRATHGPARSLGGPGRV